MLALLIQVVREMVFTLGKWSFSKKPGTFTSYYSQGSNQGLGRQVRRLNSQHTRHRGAARGLATESAARLTHSGARARTNYGSPALPSGQPQRGAGANRVLFRAGPRGRAPGRNSGSALALTEEDMCGV